MQFNPSSGDQGIVQHVDFLANTDRTSYPLADVVRQANIWYYRTLSWIWQSDDIWEFDDANKTDMPIADATLVDDQALYTLPTETGTATGGAAYNVLRVEVLDSGGDRIKLSQIDETDIDVAISEFRETKGLPQHYRLTGSVMELFPAPDTNEVTASSGLRIHLQRGLDKFTASDTTQEPGFPEPFHPLLSYGAAYDWLLINGEKEKATTLRSEIEAMKADMASHYGSRNRERKPKIMPASMRNRNFHIR